MTVDDAMEIVAELRIDDGADDPEATINVSPQLLFSLDGEVRQLRVLWEHDKKTDVMKSLAFRAKLAGLEAQLAAEQAETTLWKRRAAIAAAEAKAFEPLALEALDTEAKLSAALANNTQRNVSPEMVFNTWRPELMAELLRYREREPLVQALLRTALTQDAIEDFEDLVDRRASAVRDFDLQPSKKEQKDT